jgi:hypothetical protein
MAGDKKPFRPSNMSNKRRQFGIFLCRRLGAFLSKIVFILPRTRCTLSFHYLDDILEKVVRDILLSLKQV